MASGIAFFLMILYTGLFYIRPQDFIPGLSEFSLLVLCLWSSIFFWILVPKKRFVLPQFMLLIGLALSIFLSLLLSGWAGGAVKSTGDFLQVIAYFSLLVHVVNSVKRFKIFFSLVIMCCLVFVLHGYVQLSDGIAWTGVRAVDGRIRYVGAFNDPNDLGMAFVIAFAMALFFIRKGARASSKLFGLVTAGLILYGVFLTNSRGTSLAIAILVLIMGYKKYGRLLAVLLTPVIGAAMYALAPSRVDSIDDDSSRERVEAWFEGWQMFKSHPFFGVGRDQFKDYNHITAHNSFVLAYSELGFIGYFFWFSLLLVSTVQLYYCLKAINQQFLVATPIVQTRLAELKALGWALTNAYVGAIVCAFFLSRSFATITYMLLGLIGAYYHFILKEIPSTTIISMRSYWRTCFASSLASIAFFALLTKFLIFTR